MKTLRDETATHFGEKRGDRPVKKVFTAHKIYFLFGWLYEKLHLMCKECRHVFV